MGNFYQGIKGCYEPTGGAAHYGTLMQQQRATYSSPTKMYTDKALGTQSIMPMDNLDAVLYATRPQTTQNSYHTKTIGNCH